MGNELKATHIQALLLIVAALAITAVVLLAVTNRPARPVALGIAPSGGVVVDPIIAYVRYASALSDSLHDQTEALIDWMSTTQDTTGLAERALRHDVMMRSALDELDPGVSPIAQQDVELLAGLFLEYLDALDITLEDPARWSEFATSYRAQLRRSRSEIEPLLMSYLGSF